MEVDLPWAAELHAQYPQVRGVYLVSGTRIWRDLYPKKILFIFFLFFLGTARTVGATSDLPPF